MADDHDQDRDQHEAYRARISDLEAENAHLRESANAFGELAERLNKQLREERRKAAERRTEKRSPSDRRVPPASSWSESCSSIP